ncbi:hypothetical protein V8F20_003925 [Naviculisporaceae sp. PSN 640]
MAPSWLEIDPDSDFSIDNIPFGIISTSSDSQLRAAVAIGEYVLDLKILFGYYSEQNNKTAFETLFPNAASLNFHHVFAQSTLNQFADLGPSIHGEVRCGIRTLLLADTMYPQLLKDNAPLRQAALYPNDSNITMHLPMAIGDYTDFYAGYHHAFAVGKMFRGAANAIQPNYTHLPVGYHGRASTIGVSGASPARIVRPVGQIILDPTAEVKTPITGLSRKLDFELELGCFISRPGSSPGRVDIRSAEANIFGYVLLNDWSARDIQAWEYVPLGPFNSKNFATTISPWVVLASALEPYRAEGIPNPTPLQDYLKEEREDAFFDIKLEVDLIVLVGDVTTNICHTSSTNLMWSFPQMIAHHTLGGCELRTGDLLGSGTISGPHVGESGSLLELSENGKKEVLLAGMEARTFLKDGDTVVLRGYCKGAGGGRVGFGECKGRIYPAHWP